jgi:amidophosphoribosyltransferase
MTKLLQCDTLIFQTLDDLKAACVEASDGKTQVRDFEAGVFCGKYQSIVPPDYLERSRRLYESNKKRKAVAITTEDGDGSALEVMVASSGPTVGPREEPYRNGTSRVR